MRYKHITQLLKTKLGHGVGNFVISLLRPLYLVLRLFKSILCNLQLFYEARIAPFLAVHAGWMFWPIYKLLAAQNICFVANIGDVPGHINFELDSFFRKLKLGEIAKDKRYVWIRKSTDISKACVKLYKHKFWLALSNNLVYNLLFPIIIRYKDITVTCGNSRLKWQLPDDLNYHKTKFGQHYWYLYQTTRSDEHRQYKEYYKRRLKCKDFFPLLESIYINADNELIRFLNDKTEKLALIHIKTKKINATIKPTDPNTYLLTLQYLSDAGYRLIFVGREEMPQEFLKYKVINYANSNIATYKHDIQLFKMAELVITAGSGISTLPDCLDKPFLFLNSWHLPLLLFSRKCISVPSLLQDSSGRFLKFSEQINLYNSLHEPKSGAYPDISYEGRNATSEEILKAIQELILLKKNFIERTPLQERFRKLTYGTPSFWALSRINEYFLQKHIDLFDE